MTQAEGAVLAGWVTLKTNARDGGSSNTIHRFKFWDKVRALEILFKHFGLLMGCVELTDTGDLIAILNAGRQRAAELKRQRDQQKQLPAAG